MAKRHSTDLATRPNANLPARVLADRVVSKLREAEKALQFVTTIHQAKLVADVAAAQEVFAHRQRLGAEIEGYAYRIKTQALAKLGELLRDLPKAVGTRGQLAGAGPGRGKTGGTKIEPPVSSTATLSEVLNLPKSQAKKLAAVAQQLAALPIPVRDAIASGELNLRQATQSVRQHQQKTRHDERVTALADVARGNVPLGTETHYPVIYADPPWRYEHVKTESRAIENQYPTMSLDEICALQVGDLSTPDAVLFLWATSPKLAESMRVIDAWGFTYRTCAVWVKDKIGMGYYFRQRHELLLVAAKGAPPMPVAADRVDSVFEYPRLDHSAKPIQFYDVIDRMYPEFPKIELFCRAPRTGWASWGNQAVAS